MKNIKEYKHRYYERFKDRDLEKRRRNYRENKERDKKTSKRNRLKNIKSWEKVIPKVTKCQICEKHVYFNKRNPNKAVHFDHRNGKTTLSHKTPTGWLMSHPWTVEKENEWKSFGFGKLCRPCNAWLKSENRKWYIKKVVKYVFGDNYEIKSK
jgi:hypothetical protein